MQEKKSYLGDRSKGHLAYSVGGCHETEMLGVRNDDEVSPKVVLSFWKAYC
jgi:hypothetical protein